jgi:putative acetyltransferase
MTGAFVVRPLNVDDLDQLLDLFIAVVDEGRWLGTEAPVDREAQRERFAQALDQPDSTASLVAVDGDDIVGHVGVHLERYGVAGLGMMVADGWRGRGVGGVLVDEAIDRARAMGAHKLALQVWPHNDVARRLYLNHGFAEEGVLRRHYRRRNGELWDAVIMGLVLDDTSPGASLPA